MLNDEAAAIAERARFQADLALAQLRRCLRFDLQEGISDLEATFKQRAKELQAGLERAGHPTKLMRAQEALARSMGFPTTHALQQALKGLAQVEGLDEGRTLDTPSPRVSAQLAPFVRLYQLDQDFHRSGMPLEDPELDLLAQFVPGLVAALGVPEALMRDVVANSWARAATWDHLTTRSPLDDALGTPLLTFTVDGDPSSRKSEGRFHLSEAGHWIWDNVLGSDEDSRPDPQTPELAREQRDFALELFRRYPDLYVAAGAAASASVDHHQALRMRWTTVLGYLTEGIKAAEACWPKGFKGTLPWGHLDNRPYLRMLHQLLELQLQTRFGWRSARRTARKLMRLNPQDGGMQSWAPILLGLGASPAVRNRLCKKAVRPWAPQVRCTPAWPGSMSESSPCLAWRTLSKAFFGYRSSEP